MLFRKKNQQTHLIEFEFLKKASYRHLGFIVLLLNFCWICCCLVSCLNPRISLSLSSQETSFYRANSSNPSSITRRVSLKRIRKDKHKPSSARVVSAKNKKRKCFPFDLFWRFLKQKGSCLGHIFEGNSFPILVLNCSWIWLGLSPNPI